MGKETLFTIMKKINKEGKNAETYNTGLAGERLIIATYKTMPIEKLEKMRYIINKIIKSKKIAIANKLVEKDEATKS